MAAAERARARPQRIVFWPLRKPKTHMNITAVTPAQMVHKVESRNWQCRCQESETNAASARGGTIEIDSTFGKFIKITDPVARG
jgi:hypothetical protein